MHSKNIFGAEIIINQPLIRTSPDSYIRLTLKELRLIPLIHLISGLDENKSISLQNSAIFTEITGYTEWVSETMPCISIGWDWMIQPGQVKDGFYKRISEPRSNLMLIDAQQQDFGPIKTATLIETVIDEMDWQSVIHHYISIRYTC